MLENERKSCCKNVKKLDSALFIRFSNFFSFCNNLLTSIAVVAQDTFASRSPRGMSIQNITLVLRTVKRESLLLNAFEQSQLFLTRWENDENVWLKMMRSYRHSRADDIRLRKGHRLGWRNVLHSTYGLIFADFVEVREYLEWKLNPDRRCTPLSITIPAMQSVHFKFLSVSDLIRWRGEKDKLEIWLG